MIILFFVTLVLLGFYLENAKAEACTSIIVGCDRTQNGKILHAHLEDMGINAAGILWHSPEQVPREKIIDVPYVKIEQPQTLRSYWAAGNADNSAGLGIETTEYAYDNILVGINANEVVMSCNWCYSKEDNALKSGIRRYAMRQLILERAASAREGVELLGEWIDRYGQADWGGLQFQLSDSNEAWIIETTTIHWIARKIKDDEIFCVANRFTIEEDFDLCSEKLISFAAEKGWYDRRNTFNFANAYTLPSRRNSRYDVEREERIKSLLSGKKVNMENILDVLEDRYEGTDLFMVPNNEQEIWESESEEKNIPRPICTNLAQSFFVAEHSCKEQMNRFIFMIGLGTPGYSGLVPIFHESMEIDPHFTGQDTSEPSAWKIFRKIQLQTDAEYEKNSATVKESWRDFNKQTIIEAEEICSFTVSAAERKKFTYNRSKELICYAKKLLK